MYHGQKLSAAYGVCCRSEACVIFGQHITVGGYITIVAGFCAAGSIDPNLLEWVMLPPQAFTGRPYKKSGCGMVLNKRVTNVEVWTKPCGTGLFVLLSKEKREKHMCLLYNPPG